MKIKTKIITIALIALVVFSINSKEKTEPKIEKRIETKEIEKEETHKEWVEKQFSKWDGSHIELTKQIKESLNNPDSYKHVKTTYSVDKNKDLIVFTKFRATNEYSAVVTLTIKAQISHKDDTITILDVL